MWDGYSGYAGDLRRPKVQSSVEVQKGQLEGPQRLGHVPGHSQAVGSVAAGVALGLGAGLLTAEPAYANARAPIKLTTCA